MELAKRAAASIGINSDLGVPEEYVMFTYLNYDREGCKQNSFQKGGTKYGTMIPYCHLSSCQKCTIFYRVFLSKTNNRNYIYPKLVTYTLPQISILENPKMK